MDEKDDKGLMIIEYEVIRNQRFMIETARDFLLDVNPWKTRKDEVEDELVITVKEFRKWRQRLLKILGVSVDE